MGIFTKDIKTMDDLFLHQLEDIYYAEQQLTKAIPKMADMATNADLKAGLQSHVIDTKNQIERLDKIFAKLGKQPKGTDCPAIDGLVTTLGPEGPSFRSRERPLPASGR